MALLPAARNAFVSTKLNEYLERVKAGQGPARDRYKAERKVLERLIPIATDGFRGVTLTAIMGKHVREDINTATEFNAINPRGIFEKAIKPTLKMHRIPTGASAPLNVAKNIQVLDEKWAEGRKPEDAALAAVDYIRRINRHWQDPDLRDDLIMMFMQRLVEYAEEVGSHDVDLAPLRGEVPVTLAKRISAFALAYPEGGSMPQFIVGALLAATRASDTNYLPLEGTEASVFGTNSTSNKPADLWETQTSGALGNLYEVTCKPVDEDRLSAAVDSFAKLGIATMPVTFICRMPQDSAKLNLVNGSIVYRGLPFQFLDISTFIEAIYIMLTLEKQLAIFETIASFVNEPMRAVTTKKAWRKEFGVSG